MGRCLLEFNLLRRKAAARVRVGGPFPAASVSVLRMQSAAQSDNGKSLVLSSVHGSLDFPSVANRMRQVFEPCGGVAKQDGHEAAAVEVDADRKDLTYEAWVAYRKAERARKGSPRGSRSKSSGANEVKEDRQVLSW